MFFEWKTDISARMAPRVDPDRTWTYDDAEMISKEWENDSIILLSFSRYFDFLFYSDQKIFCCRDRRVYAVHPVCDQLTFSWMLMWTIVKALLLTNNRWRRQSWVFTIKSLFYKKKKENWFLLFFWACAKRNNITIIEGVQVKMGHVNQPIASRDSWCFMQTRDASLQSDK